MSDKSGLGDMTINSNSNQPKPKNKDMTLNDVNDSGIIVISGGLYDKVKMALRGGAFTPYTL